MPNPHTIPFTLLAPFLCLYASIASAQNNEVLNIEIEQLFELEEIIITAQKQTENLQDVPVSITAFDTNTIDTFDLNNINNIEALTPGFSASRFSIGQPQFYIRGIGSNEDSAGGDASVAVYADGVYIARPSASTFTFNDIQRIEVLRGPQGTLYGRNAIGGAINIISNKPGDKEESNFELTAGNYSRLKIKFKTNTPHSDTTFSNFALVLDRRDGYIENTTTGNELQDINDRAARWQTLFAFSDNTELLIAVDVEDVDRLGNARRATGSNAAQADISINYPDNIFKTTADTDGFQKRDAGGIRLELNSLIGDIQLTSLTAYRESRYRWLEDISGVSNAQALANGGNDVNNGVVEDSEQLSQELRFSYNKGGIIDGVAGVYFLNEKAHRQEEFEFFVIQGQASPLNFLIADPTNGVADIFGLNGLWMDLNGDGIADINDFALYWGPKDSVIDSFNQKSDSTSTAIFGQSNIHLTEALNLSLGLRYSDEKKDFSNSARTNNLGFIDFLVLENYSISETESWDTLTWRIALDYQWLENFSTYLSADKGFKSGGFQGQSATAEVAAKPFDPEHAKSYELGLKSLWWDNRVRLNLAHYYTRYTDMQVLQSISSGTARAIVTENAGEATTSGFELDYQWQVFSMWRIGGSYAYNNGEFDKLEIQDNTGNTVDLSGNRLRNSPRHNFAFLSELSLFLPNDSEIMFALMYTYRDETYQDLYNYELNKFPSRRLLDMSLNWYSNDETVSVSGWVKNAANEEYKTHSFDDSDGQISVATYGPPRQFGLTLNLHF